MKLYTNASDAAYKEIERLRALNTKLLSEYEVRMEQLAASQAREKVLREALNGLLDVTAYKPKRHQAIEDAYAALDHSTDDTALRNYVADEMEKAANELYVHSAKDELVDYAERYRKGEV